MEEIGATIPKYQPLRVLWCPFLHTRQTNHCFQPDSLITQELVPSLFVESITQSLSKLIQLVF